MGAGPGTVTVSPPSSTTRWEVRASTKRPGHRSGLRRFRASRWRNHGGVRRHAPWRGNSVPDGIVFGRIAAQSIMAAHGEVRSIMKETVSQCHGCSFHGRRLRRRCRHSDVRRQAQAGLHDVPPGRLQARPDGKCLTCHADINKGATRSPTARKTRTFRFITSRNGRDCNLCHRELMVSPRTTARPVVPTVLGSGAVTPGIAVIRRHVERDGTKTRPAGLSVCRAFLYGKFSKQNTGGHDINSGKHRGAG